jgi:hypothetical protein
VGREAEEVEGTAGARTGDVVTATAAMTQMDRRLVGRQSLVRTSVSTALSSATGAVNVLTSPGRRWRMWPKERRRP